MFHRKIKTVASKRGRAWTQERAVIGSWLLLLTELAVTESNYIHTSHTALYRPTTPDHHDFHGHSASLSLDGGRLFVGVIEPEDPSRVEVSDKREGVIVNFEVELGACLRVVC